MPAPIAPPSSALPSPAEPLAPRWHTAALIAVIVAVAATGLLLTSRGVAPTPPAPAGSRVLVYLPMLVVQLGLLVYVSRVGRPRSALRSLLGARWASPARAAVDVALGLAGWALILGCELLWARLFATGTAASVTSLLPHTLIERLTWLVVAVVVSFSEEVVFRGYFQTQLAAFTGKPAVAVLLQATLFGLAHAEQGAGAMLRLGLYGLAFGALARWRKSLLPGIVGHMWTDLASGLLRP